jgi:hypothetical protein
MKQFSFFPHGLGQHLLSLFHTRVPPSPCIVLNILHLIVHMMLILMMMIWFMIIEKNGRNRNVKCLNLRNTFHLKWEIYVLFLSEVDLFNGKFLRRNCFVSYFVVLGLTDGIFEQLIDFCCIYVGC